MPNKCHYSKYQYEPLVPGEYTLEIRDGWTKQNKGLNIISPPIPKDGLSCTPMYSVQEEAVSNFCLTLKFDQDCSLAAIW